MDRDEGITSNKNRTALVTGGSVRIGRAISDSLLAAGWNVAIQYRASVSAARQWVDQSLANGGNAAAFAADLSDVKAADSLLNEVGETFGNVDLLVNNASVFNKTGFMEAGEESMADELVVNALTPIQLSRAFARQYRSAGAKSGLIINLLDRRIASEEKGMVPYLLSKKMLYSFTRIAALELGPAIRVNGIAPGPVLPPPGEGQQYLKDKAGPIVTATGPTPSDIAQSVLFLIAIESITGQVIYVDGGQHLL